MRSTFRRYRGRPWWFWRNVANRRDRAASDPAAPTLGALAVSPNTATVGTPFSATISGKTAGSTLSLSGAGAAGLSIAGITISGTPTTAGAVDIVETLAGAVGSPRTTSGAVTVGAATIASVMAASGREWIDATQSGTITGSPVSKIVSPRSSLPSFIQKLSAKRPAITAGRLVFDGTEDFLDAVAPATFLSSLTLPNGASNSETGKGFTCTGLCKAPNGTWWIGNHGKKNETTQGSETFAASIVNLSADFSTILKEITLASLGIPNGAPQGIAYDTTTDTIFFADVPNSRIRQVNPATDALVATLDPALTINGLAYDSILDRLIGVTTNGALYRINKSNAFVTALGNVFDGALDYGSVDHLCFDPTYGASGAVYVTEGFNAPGRILKFALTTPSHLVRAWTLPEVAAIEGLWVGNGGFTVMDDSYYHNFAPNLNRVVTYSADLATPDYGTKLVIAGVAKIAATPAGAVALAAGGDPLNGRGVGLYFSATANQFRLLVKTGAATYDTVNWTLASTTTEFRFYVEINTVALTATLYVNGTLVSSQPFVNANAALPMLLWTMGANRELPTPAVSRFAAVSVAKLLVLTDTTQRSLVDSYLAA